LVIKSEWGKGYMTEVITAFINEVFKSENIKRIWAVCDVENIASKNVLKKSGMEYEGLLKSWLVHSNMSLKPKDCHCLCIVKNV
jgi:ribosomal-protein-alanine N-acetyltransferase